MLVTGLTNWEQGWQIRKWLHVVVDVWSTSGICLCKSHHKCSIKKLQWNFMHNRIFYWQYGNRVDHHSRFISFMLCYFVCFDCLNLFPCDGFPKIYAHAILLKDHLDLTNMVQKQMCSWCNQHIPWCQLGYVTLTVDKRHINCSICCFPNCIALWTICTFGLPI